MKKFLNKIVVLFLALWGEVLKCYIRLRGFRLKECGVNKSEKREKKVILSLTSYGRRVHDVLPYTIYSLLCQDYKPDAVVLWLDKNDWDDEKLPERIKTLKRFGLEVRYCVDLRSYTKLIPALEAFPNDIIITADDDQFYTSSMVGRIVRAYVANPTKVYTFCGRRPTFNAKGELNPYNAWKFNVRNKVDGPNFALGVTGCLYQRNLFHKDICNRELFQKLSPFADDVWFYFMEVLNGTKVEILPSSIFTYIPLDVFYQRMNQGASLMAQNVHASRNDQQIKAVMEYYGISSEDLRFY